MRQNESLRVAISVNANVLSDWKSLHFQGHGRVGHTTWRTKTRLVPNCRCHLHSSFALHISGILALHCIVSWIKLDCVIMFLVSSQPTHGAGVDEAWPPRTESPYFLYIQHSTPGVASESLCFRYPRRNAPRDRTSPRWPAPTESTTNRRRKWWVIGFLVLRAVTGFMYRV